MQFTSDSIWSFTIPIIEMVNHGNSRNPSSEMDLIGQVLIRLPLREILRLEIEERDSSAEKLITVQFLAKELALSIDWTNLPSRSSFRKAN